MSHTHTGEIAGLLTAFFWTFSALAFERATIKVGTFSVNLIRLFIGFIFLCAMAWFDRGILLPTDADFHTWFWLFLSGLVGLVLGDLFLFASYPIITSRIAMLVMTLAPPMAAVLGWILLDETMGILSITGMIVVIAGISITIWSRPEGEKKLKLNFPVKGLFYAFLGTVGQAAGLVLSKLGMKSYNAFASTQIRIIAGTFGFLVLIALLNRWKNLANALKNKEAMKSIGIGSFFGPFLGISFSLIAVQHTKAGIAATLMSIVPVLIIIPSILIYKQKVSTKEVLGAILSVAGVALFFL
ncbi:MAG: DMT family transporter [Bacteroidales bacterium]